MTTRPSRAALAFLIAATLATTALPAASLFEGGASPAGIAALEPLDLLARFWSAVNRWQVKNGCSVDPNGQCLPKRRPAVMKNGCSADPSGYCLPGTTAVATDNGCSADPDGRCIK
jgi:hypothetical protein